MLVIAPLILRQAAELACGRVVGSSLMVTVGMLSTCTTWRLEAICEIELAHVTKGVTGEITNCVERKRSSTRTIKVLVSALDDVWGRIQNPAVGSLGPCDARSACQAHNRNGAARREGPTDARCPRGAVSLCQLQPRVQQVRLSRSLQLGGRVGWEAVPYGFAPACGCGDRGWDIDA